MKKISLISVNQPIGTFYLSSINSLDLLKFVKFSRKSVDRNGFQRDVSKSRIKKILDYCDNPDATFPTAIILSVDSRTVNIEGDQMSYEEEKISAYVIDGQHRLLGIDKYNDKHNFDLPVVLMFDLSVEEEAYVFSIINSTQTKVSTSLLYDLFDVYETDSPQKTCHIIARTMNQDPESPFYNKLKMLGSKKGLYETLSQGTFAEHLLPMITKDHANDAKEIKKNFFKKRITLKYYDTIFRDLFINNSDNTIYKYLFDTFSALEDVFYLEWNSPDYIIAKSTGYGAIMRFINLCYKENESLDFLNYDNMKFSFLKFRIYLAIFQRDWTSTYFPSNAATQAKLAQEIYDSLSNKEVEILKNKKYTESDFSYFQTCNIEFVKNFNNISHEYKIPIYLIMQLSKSSNNYPFLINVTINENINFDISFKDEFNVICASLSMCFEGRMPLKSEENINENMKGFSEQNDTKVKLSDKDPNSIVWISRETIFGNTYITSQSDTLVDIFSDKLGIGREYSYIQLSSSELFTLYHYLLSMKNNFEE